MAIVTREEVLAEILRGRLVAVLRFDGEDDCLAAAEAAAAGGITALEVTLTTPGATSTISRLAERDGLLVGVGSVRTVAQLEAAAGAGARFMASPHIDPLLVERARELGLVAMPGALTPTEIDRAWGSGADLVKVFPMPSDGAAYLRSLLGPMPEVRLAPSGGVSPASVHRLLEAGASALNVGSWMTHVDGAVAPAHVITERARELVGAVRGIVV